MSRTRLFWILMMICVVGGILRSYQLSARSLWFDEAFSWRLIQFPFSEMIARDAADVHPPLYYILLKGWAYVFGSSVVALRSFSITAAIGSILTTYLFAAYAFRSRAVGVISALLLAVSPWAISLAWEARMYPLGMMLASASSYLLLKGSRTGKLSWFALYGIVAAAFVYIHYFALFTIAAHALFIIGSIIVVSGARIGEILHSKVFWGGLLSACIAIGLFAPWMPVFLRQRSQVQESFWIPAITKSSIPNTFYQLVAPTKTPPSIDSPTFLWSIAALVAVIGVLVWLVLWCGKKHRGLSHLHDMCDGAWLTALLAITPFILGIVVSLFGRSLYNDRFFAFAALGIFIAIARACVGVRGKRVRFVADALIVAACGVAFVQYHRELDLPHHPGAKAAAQYIFSHREGSEPIIVSSPFVYFAISHYATEDFSDPSSAKLYSSTGTLAHFSGGPILTSQDIVSPQDITAFSGRVWVVDTTGFGEHPFTAPSSWKEKGTTSFSEVFPYQGDVAVRELEVL